MKITDKIVAEILIEEGILLKDQVPQLFSQAHATGKPLGAYLIQKGIISRGEIMGILAQVFLGIPPEDAGDGAAQIVTQDALKAPMNKRVYRRIGERVEIRYQANQQEITDLAVMMIPEVEYSAATDNISASGLRFICGHFIPLGTILEIKVIIGESESLDCLARVCRVEEKTGEEYHIAVYYLDISSADRVKLNHFISGKKPDAH